MASEVELLSIRFVGENLKTIGVPIYDLAESLTAIQRIVHKAYLSQQGILSRSRLASKEERVLLALRLGERRRKSDEYALTAVLADPAMLAFYGGLAANLISGLAIYALQRRPDTRESESAPPPVFNIAIYNQVADLTNRIDGVGRIEGIEIRAPGALGTTSVVLDRASQTYVRGLKHTLVRGERRIISGRLKDFDPNRSIVRLTDGNSTIEVSMLPEIFKKIRYHSIEKPWLTLEGVPVYRLGVESDFFEKFDADDIISIEASEPEATDKG